MLSLPPEQQVFFLLMDEAVFTRLNLLIIQDMEGLPAHLGDGQDVLTCWAVLGKWGNCLKPAVGKPFSLSCWSVWSMSNLASLPRSPFHMGSNKTIPRVRWVEGWLPSPVPLHLCCLCHCHLLHLAGVLAMEKGYHPLACPSRVKMGEKWGNPMR